MLIQCRGLIKGWSVGFVIYVTPIYLYLYIYIYIHISIWHYLLWQHSICRAETETRNSNVYIVLYCVVLYCTELYCTTPLCTVRHNASLHYTTLHYTTLHYTTLHYTTTHHTTLTLHHTTPHTTPHHTTPHHTTLHYICVHVYAYNDPHSCMCDIPESPTNIVSWCDSQLNTVQMHFYFSSIYKYIMI